MTAAATEVGRGRRRLIGGALLAAIVVLCAAIFLVTTPRGEPYRLMTHCGITGLVHEGRWYERVGGSLTDEDGVNPPRGWDNPWQDGRLRISDDSVVFTDWAGHGESFTLRADPSPAPPCR
ncbi:hypothetical protein [Pedococcus bigeumensis]|uniref:Uncharacterized protein n=1 Tax=Pedococcus bigeumensis TaxID=433644 RepID=A0A502CWT3_9MICO|nr:hypothetical protein [Pedococcus bigeumensis]TPG18055.1 hypothetical protein EAH86_06490 [Pedococcus bigeumensis]